MKKEDTFRLVMRDAYGREVFNQILGYKFYSVPSDAIESYFSKSIGMQGKNISDYKFFVDGTPYQYDSSWSDQAAK